jgi:hypothetical protein
MNSLPRLASLAIAAAALLSGCAPARVAVKPEFWQSRNTRIGVAVATYPAGGAHKVGAQGLLDIAINSAMAGGLDGYLSKTKLPTFEPVCDGFVQELTKRGLPAKRLSGLVNPEELPDWKGESEEKLFGKDVAALAQAQGVDVLVLLSVRRFGTIRPYYGFIPLGAPKGFFEVKGQMVDAKTNRLLWQTLIAEADASVEAAEPWDQDPNYPNIDAALRTAIENGKAFLLREFFSVPPVQAAQPVRPPDSST